MKNPPMLVKRILSLIGFLLFAIPLYAQTQLPECEADVPFFSFDLSGSPDTSFLTPKVERQGSCCGSTNSDLYLSFYATLHPQVAMFEIVVAPGYADPGGSGDYNIISGGDLTIPGSCGTDISGGQPVCISGSGPFKITYSKPGKNNIKYIFRQIPKPIFPQDDTTRVGCSLPLSIYGLDTITITSVNSSNGITSRGYYNSLLSCIDCGTPSFSPGLATPAWIDYEICGKPQASLCGTFTNCDTVRIYTTPALSSFVSPDPASFCSNESGVDLVGSATGGDAHYTYIWRNSLGDTLTMNDSLWVNAAGTYTLETGDGLSSPTCANEFTSVPVTIGTLPTVNAGSDQTRCASTPTVYLNGTSSTSSGTWTGGAGSFSPGNNLVAAYTPTLSEISSGSLKLYLTATNVDAGCENVTDSVTITFSPLVHVNPSAPDILCHDGSTTISANATGGTAPYTYFWNTGSVNASITAYAGTYNVTAYDQFGCSATANTFVGNPTPITLTMSSTNTSTDSSCDGNASVAVSGGTTAYSYNWSNTETTATTSNTLCYGIYTVTVEDGNGCTSNGSVVVNKPSCSAFNATTTHTDANCFGSSDGTAQALPSGGTAPYTYSWNTIPAQTTQSITGIPSGNYTVIVTDDLGCTDVASVAVLQPLVLTNSITYSNVSTIGGSDGSATAHPSGGTPGYTYLWVPGSQTTPTATNLSSATGGITYHVTITDAHSCQIEDSVIINEPPCNNFYLGVNLTHVSCFGSANGSAELVIVDGTAPYDVHWSNGATSSSISGLVAGNYSVSVTDASNCTAIKTFSIGQPDALSLALVPTNVTCHSAGDGTIDLTVEGGTFPYNYAWYYGITPIADHEDLIDLTPGTYSVTVQDKNGCSISESSGISQPTVLSASSSSVDVNCYGTANGSINATVSGGVLPYTYSWTGPSSYSASSEDISSLYSGLYHLVVQDANGCDHGPMNVFINQPSLLTISALQANAVSCNGAQDGAVNATPNGGTSPYSFNWSGPSGYTSSSEDPNGLYAGTYSVTLTDDHLCTATTSLNVTTIADTTDPVITCHADIVVETSISSCLYTQTGTALDAVATDNCQLSSLSYVLTGVTTGTGNSLNTVQFNKGITQVTWTATDASGNTATCTFNVTVNDSTIPIIQSCGVSGTANVITDAGYCSYTHHGSTWIPTVTDNCSVTIALNYVLTGATSGSGSNSLNNVEFNYGNTLVTWTATDVSGNTVTCSFDVIVDDQQAPIFTSCGAGNDTIVAADFGVCTFRQTSSAWNALAVDLCTSTTLTYTLSGATSGTGTSLTNVPFNLGSTLVTWTATDQDGNTATCSFNVTVEDTQAPGISCVGNQSMNVDAGQCNYTKTGTGWNATTTDNCTVSTVLASLSGATTASGITSLANVDFGLGTTTVLWTVTDGSGNTATCSFDVEVSDNILPSISSCGAAGNTAINVDAGQCNFTQTGTDWNATATDNCTVSTVLVTLSGATTASGLTSLAGVDFNLGTTTVLWTVTDGSGNTSTCSFDVKVSDNILPSISSCGAAGNPAVNVDAGQCNFTQTGTGWNATATDNCTVSTVLATLSGATTASGLTTLAGVDFNLGTTTVLWTVTDGSGNTSTCSFDIEVSDNILPSISSCGAAGNPAVNVDAGQCNFTQPGTGWNAIATDNCTVSNVIATLSGATTASGLTSLAGVDFNLGTTTVFWTVTDGSGNTSTCSFDVEVSDNILPSISSCGAAGNPSVNVDAGQCNFTQTGTGWNATATDNCTVINVIATLSGATTASGLTTLAGVDFNLGTTTVLWTVTDGSGNTSTCSFDVEVSDNQVPVFSECIGSDQTVNTDPTECTYQHPTDLWDAHASDLCSSVSLAYSLSGATSGAGSTLNGQVFNQGTTVITWTATDESGNTTTCSFNVLVDDTETPEFATCGTGSPIVVPSNSGLCTFTQTTAAWNATASDNCGAVTLHYDLTGATTGTGTTLAGQTFGHGNTTVTWTATDSHGNTTTCSYDVTVTDSQVPIITSCGGGGSHVVETSISSCQYVHTNTAWDPIASDNCGSVSMSYTLGGSTQGTGTSLSGVAFELGTTSVLWTVSDNNGNTSTCSFTVLVNDSQTPILTNCLSGETLEMSTDEAACTFTQPDASLNPTATDNCTISSGICILTGATTGSFQSLTGVSFNTGTTIVNWVFTDQSGNSANCSYAIHVVDHEAPVLTGCPDDIVINTANGQCGRTISWTAPIVSDNCQATAVSSIQSGTFFATGTTVVTYTATDNSGNQSTCSFTVTVSDLEAPVINCNADISSCDPHINYSIPVASDNCGISTIVLKNGLPSGSIFPVGTTVVTFEATDMHGNKSQCSFNVVIHPTPAAYITATDISCHGHNNGLADLTVVNGSSPFSYTWSNGESTEDLTDLSAGSYSVNIVDQFGCSTSAQVSIQEPVAITMFADVQPVACHGGSTGAIDLTVSGGDGNYTYIWSDGQQTQDADSLATGNYMVIVTDGKGCAASLTTAIYQPDTLLMELTAFPATCAALDGSIQGSASGGTAPYSYSWSNGQTGPTLTNAAAGSYTLTVTDANGCMVHLRKTITSVSDLQVSSIVQNVSCYGEANGTARLIPENAQPPYEITWSNGDAGISVDSLSTGTYTAYFTDANGCKDTLEVSVSQPDSMELQVSLSENAAGYNVSEYAACDGWIEAIPIGGTAEYSYLWSNGAADNYIQDLCAGTYAIIVTDANGCSISRSIVVSQPLELEMPNGFSPNDDGDNDAFVVHGLDAYPDNELIIFNRWGNIVFQKEDYQNDWHGENNQSEPIPDSTYFVILKVNLPADGTITLTGYVDLRRN